MEDTLNTQHLALGTLFHVAYACDNNYAIQTGVSLFSLFKNNTGIALCAHIFSDGIAEDSLAEYRAIASRFGQSVDIKPLPDYNKMAGVNMSVKGRFAMSTYSTLFLSQTVGEDVKRILWIDSDTIIDGSLAELFTADMTGCAAAMVQNIGTTSKRLHCFDRDEKYFNAGIVLFDLDFWRANGIYDDMLREIARRHGRSIGTDQSYINTVLRGRIAEVMPKFNWMGNFLPALADYNAFLRDGRYTARDPRNTAEELQEAARDTRIFHDSRMTRDGHPFHAKWLEYLGQTKWSNTPLPVRTKKPVKPHKAVEAMKSASRSVGLYGAIKSVKLFFLLEVRPITRVYVRAKWGFWPPRKDYCSNFSQRNISSL